MRATLRFGVLALVGALALADAGGGAAAEPRRREGAS